MNKKRPTLVVSKRNFTKRHRKRLSKSLKSNKNAIKHGKYSELRTENCSDCHLQSKCPKYQANSLCVYSDALKRFPKWERFKRNPDVIIKRLYDEVQDQVRLLELNKYSNLKHGNRINKELRAERKELIANLKLLYDMSTGGEKLKVKVETNPVDKIFAKILNKRKKRAKNNQDK